MAQRHLTRADRERLVARLHASIERLEAALDRVPDERLVALEIQVRGEVDQVILRDAPGPGKAAADADAEEHDDVLREFDQVSASLENAAARLPADLRDQLEREWVEDVDDSLRQRVIRQRRQAS